MPKAAARRSPSRSTNPAPAVHRFSERFECRTLRHPVRDPPAAAVLVQQPVRRLPDVPRLRQHHRARHESRRARSRPSRFSRTPSSPGASRTTAPQLAELKRAAKGRVRLDVPWSALTEEERRFVIEGDGGGFEGVKGFFRWLERKKYKVHVRVFLSRYRGYLTCPECGGAAAPRSARRAGRRGHHRRRLRPTVRDAEHVLRRPGARPKGVGDRRQGAEGDPQAARRSCATSGSTT